MISSLIMPKSSAYKTVFGFDSKTAGVPPNLGVALCEERGFLLRLRQKSQGLSIFHSLLKHIDILINLFSISDDGSIKYIFPGRKALLRWISKSTYFIIMTCFKLCNVSRHLKDSSLMVKFPLFAYKPIKLLTNHWLNLVVSNLKSFMQMQNLK